MIQALLNKMQKAAEAPDAIEGGQTNLANAGVRKKGRPVSVTLVFSLDSDPHLYWQPKKGPVFRPEGQGDDVFAHTTDPSEVAVTAESEATPAIAKVSIAEIVNY